jgi:hypothetical protein
MHAMASMKNHKGYTRQDLCGLGEIDVTDVEANPWNHLCQ